MTNDEFSSQFDIYYNNVTSNAAPGLNEYEKSVFLTRASEDIVIELYNGRSVPGVSFESNEDNRILRTDIDGKVILYSKHPISKYLITYIKHPNPIITESLEGLDVTIEDKTKSTTDIHPILHRAILERAVALAKIAYDK